MTGSHYWTFAVLVGVLISGEARAAFNPYQSLAAGTASVLQGVCLKGDDVSCASAGDYIRFDGMTFGTAGADRVSITLQNTSATSGHPIEIRVGSPSGQLLGTLTTTNTNGAFIKQTVIISRVVGTQNIVFRFAGVKEVGAIDRIQFTAASGAAPTPTPVATPTPVPTPTPSPTPVAGSGCPANSVVAAVGSNLQSIINGAAVGAAICIKAGEHRMQSFTPKANQQIYGEQVNGQNAAVLNGSRLITSFTRDGAYWVASGQTQKGEVRISDECSDGMPRCGNPEAFFINNVPLLATDTKAKVVAGKFYFDYAAQKIYFLDDPTGKKVEASVSPYAILGGVSGVRVEGLIVEKYSTPVQFGAIGSNLLPINWIITKNETRLNYALGLIAGQGSQVIGNFTHDNGEMGLGCNGNDILIEGNEIARNGAFSGVDPLWEGGGMKCAETNRLIVRNNYSHDNAAMGLWTDINNVNTLYEGNRIENNATGGISHEISYSAIIRNNTFKGNGHKFFTWLWGGAIQIQNSQNVEVYGNTVDAGSTGNTITMIQQDRGTGTLGAYKTINNYVHNNTIIATSTNAGVGMTADYDVAGLLNGNNRFNANSYYLPTSSDDYFWWGDDNYTFAQFKSSAGQEASGVFHLGLP